MAFLLSLMLVFAESDRGVRGNPGEEGVSRDFLRMSEELCSWLQGVGPDDVILCHPGKPNDVMVL